MSLGIATASYNMYQIQFSGSPSVGKEQIQEKPLKSKLKPQDSTEISKFNKKVGGFCDGYYLGPDTLPMHAAATKGISDTLLPFHSFNPHAMPPIVAIQEVLDLPKRTVKIGNDSFEGHFSGNYMIFGKATLGEGRILHGYFNEQRQLCGMGSRIFNEKIIESGQFRDGQFISGIVQFLNGGYDIGERLNRDLHCKNGTRYNPSLQTLEEGEFQNNNFVKGIQKKFTDGIELHGTFIDGYLEGQGKRVNKHGITEEGLFKKGKFISGKIIYPNGVSVFYSNDQIRVPEESIWAGPLDKKDIRTFLSVPFKEGMSVVATMPGGYQLTGYYNHQQSGFYGLCTIENALVGLSAWGLCEKSMVVNGEVNTTSGFKAQFPWMGHHHSKYDSDTQLVSHYINYHLVQQGKPLAGSECTSILTEQHAPLLLDEKQTGQFNKLRKNWSKISSRLFSDFEKSLTPRAKLGEKLVKEILGIHPSTKHFEEIAFRNIDLLSSEVSKLPLEDHLNYGYWLTSIALRDPENTVKSNCIDLLKRLIKADTTVFKGIRTFARLDHSILSSSAPDVTMSFVTFLDHANTFLKKELPDIDFLTLLGAGPFETLSSRNFEFYIINTKQYASLFDAYFPGQPRPSVAQMLRYDMFEFNAAAYRLPKVGVRHFDSKSEPIFINPEEGEMMLRLSDEIFSYPSFTDLTSYRNWQRCAESSLKAASSALGKAPASTKERPPLSFDDIPNAGISK